MRRKQEYTRGYSVVGVVHLRGLRFNPTNPAPSFLNFIKKTIPSLSPKGAEEAVQYKTIYSQPPVPQP